MKKTASKDLLRERRAIREKRGTGSNESYVPFIKIGRDEFASHGLSTYYPSTFQFRHYHLLSNLEASIVMYIETLQPSDIREQYPLRLEGVEEEFMDVAPEAEGTLQIAKSLGICHPRFSREEPRRMTTDIVASFPSGHCLPVFVKYASDLEEKRNLELLKIAQIYWRQRGAKLTVATEHSVNQTVVNNLKMFRSYQDENAINISDEWLRSVIEEARYTAIGKVLRAMAAKEGAPEAVLVDRLKASVSRGRVRLNLSTGCLRWSSVWPPMTLIEESSFEREYRALNFDE